MARMAWAPLLDGELRARAIAAVSDTVAQVRTQRGVTPNVAHGLGGFALLLLEANRSEHRLATARDVERMLARVVRLVAEVPLAPGLYEGYTGAGLTLELARRAGFARVASLDELDRALLRSVEQFGAHAYLDLVTGLAGQAIYARARLPRARARRVLEVIVDWLARRAIAVGATASWLTPPRPAPAPDLLPGSIFDLGVAHGAPGIVAVLARLLEAGIAPRITRPLLARGTRWLIDQEQARAGAAFDTYAAPPAGVPAGGAAIATSRLAWCYGDPGVACALVSAAHALRDRRLHARLPPLIRRIAARRDDPSVRDASLCHGTAGLLHIFHRLYRATGEPAARDAAIHWAQRTLDVRASRDAMGPDSSGEASPYRPLRLLAGATGSALALLAAASARAPRWDAIMLLDLPTNAAAPPRRAVRDRQEPIGVRLDAVHRAPRVARGGPR